MIAVMPVRLMIVDDHEALRRLLRAIVDDAPEDVIVSGEADGAEAALEAIELVDPACRLRAGLRVAPTNVNCGWVGELRGRPGGEIRTESWIGVVRRP